MFSWVEIKKTALSYNLQQFKNLVGKKTYLLPVIKANAYGHDFDLIARLCAVNKNADYLCVVNSDEAKRLIDLKINKPILILSFYSDNLTDLHPLIKKGVIFSVYRLDQLDFLNRAAKMFKIPIKIHVKIDTGTTRIGFLKKDLSQLIKKIKQKKWLLLAGIFSHFSSSEDNPIVTEQQYTIFKKFLTVFKKNNLSPSMAHIACTAGLLGYHLAECNAVRLGLGLYGLMPDQRFRKQIKLRPVLSWHTRIIQIKTVPPKTKIGYGGSFITKKTTRLAVLPVGYWDGYVRILSNQASVLIKGKRCPVRGKICMNLMMVEIIDNINIRVGDKATLIGKNGDDEITAEELALWSQTINYEVVTRINPTIPRILIN